MQYDKELIAHKLDRWDRFITDYHLPEWDAIPDLGLYMDQVVVLLAQYLNFILAMPGGKESFVTSSTINNYVRLKIMPAPVKAEILPGPHRLSHHDPDHEAEHQHQRRAEDHPGGHPRGGRPGHLSGVFREIPPHCPVFQPTGPGRGGGYLARRTSPARPPCPGWSSKAP